DLLLRVLGNQCFYPGIVFSLDLTDIQLCIRRHPRDQLARKSPAATANFQNPARSAEVDLADHGFHKKRGAADDKAVFGDVAFEIAVNLDEHNRTIPSFCMPFCNSLQHHTPAESDFLSCWQSP